MGFWSTAEKDGAFAVRDHDGAVLAVARTQEAASLVVNGLNYRDTRKGDEGWCVECKKQGAVMAAAYCFGHHMAAVARAEASGSSRA